MEAVRPESTAKALAFSLKCKLSVWLGAKKWLVSTFRDGSGENRPCGGCDSACLEDGVVVRCWADVKVEPGLGEHVCEEPL